MAGSSFGTDLVAHMPVARAADGTWGTSTMGPLEPLAMHPASHALHYGSACFEGLKAHRGVDGVVRIFRLADHVRRLQGSAEILVLPVPPADLVAGMITDLVRASLDDVPEAPGALYLRPTLLGTLEHIGAAAEPSRDALLFVLAARVGDYFTNDGSAFVVAVETELPRTTPQFGMVKAGANYAMALGPTRAATAASGAAQVLFTRDGAVEETGASNVLLLDGERIVTPALTSSFLHGVTRASLLELGADLGYEIEERRVELDEVLAWAARPDGEIALSGTAAVLRGVDELVVDGERVTVGGGVAGGHPNADRLRSALLDLQQGRAEDRHGWCTAVHSA